MGREGRKFKLCSSCLLLLFTGMIIYYGETTVKNVKEDYDEWREDELAKRAIMKQVHKEYNLKKTLKMRDNFWSIITAESDKYHTQAIHELGEEAQNSLLYILKEERIWNALVLASFKLRCPDKSDQDKIDKTQWQNTSELFTYAQDQSDLTQQINSQNKIFQKIAGKDSNMISLPQYSLAFSDFNKFLLSKILASPNQEVIAKKPIAEFLFQYFAFEVSIYQDCNRKINQPQPIMGEEDDDLQGIESDKVCIGFKPLLLYALEKEERWKIISECIFTILDQNQNSEITSLEIDQVLLALEFKDSTIKKFQDALQILYQRDNKKVIQHDDFYMVMERMRAILLQYEKEQDQK